MPDILHDGDYTTPVTNGAPKWQHPFRANGDNVTAFFDQEYWQRRDTFLPVPFSTAHPTLRDFYLISETQPVEFLAGLVSFVRRYSKIPKQQVVPGYMYVTKPTIPGTFPKVYGSSVVFQPDPSVSTYEFYTPQTVTGDTGAGTGQLTGGTWQLTYGASTTSAIAYDANATTVQGAINALSSISSGDGVTVTGTAADGFVITFNAHALPTLNAASITVSGGSKNTVVSNNGPSVGFWTFNFIFPDAGQTITGGTFTFTIFGQTTSAIAYNASLSTCASAINALSNVSARGGVTVLGDGAATTIFTSGQVRFRVQFNAFSLFTATTTNLTPPGTTAAATAGESSGLNYVQNLRFTIGTTNTRTFTVANHGITTADDIFVLIGDTYYTIPSGSFTVPTSSTIAIQASAGEAYFASGYATLLGKKNGETYTAGLKLTRCSMITDFYLPGVTPGIQTADDIPLATYQGDPAALLEAIFAASTQINIEVGELMQWMGTPILSRTIRTINASTL